jgi:hypothetical protein
MRAQIALEDRSALQLERSAWNETGFVGVSKVGNKYQARINVPGDGRGGQKKRRQHSLPGPFDTAEDAAVIRAAILKGFKESGDGKIHSPPKQNKKHKPRAKPRAKPAEPEVEPVEMPVATAMAVHVLCMHPQLPIVPATPLPMQPLFPPLV